MIQTTANHTVVLAGYGFEGEEPYLLFNNVSQGTQRRFFVREKTFSMRRLPKRRCIGRFDLATHERSVCPLKVELLEGSKDDMCPACMDATGFNPSFYYADTVSPQQRAYNLAPHYVYLAYFGPAYIKAGISSESRGIARLLEQGARAACIVGRFEDAYKARELEEALCAQMGILETMRASKKLELFAQERYDSSDAKETLEAALVRLARIDEVVQKGFNEGARAQDFSTYYFNGPSPAYDTVQIPKSYDNECAGRCVGMVGNILVLEQGGMNYAVSLKGWESHEIEFFENQIRCEYDFAPQQMSLL